MTVFKKSTYFSELQSTHTFKQTYIYNYKYIYFIAILNIYIFFLSLRTKTAKSEIRAAVTFVHILYIFWYTKNNICDNFPLTIISLQIQ